MWAPRHEAESGMRTKTMPERRRGRDAEAARVALLNAAEAIFARDGYSGARIDAIAEESGYNKALIFHYYDDKLGLYRAVVQRMKREMYEVVAQQVMELIADPNTPLDAPHVRAFLEQGLRLTFAFYQSHQNFLRILTWEAAEGWQTFTKLHASLEHVWACELLDYLSRAQAAGILRQDIDLTILVSNMTGCMMNYLTSIPRLQLMFAVTDLTTPDALAMACEQLIGLIIHGAMTFPERTQHDAAGV